MKAWINIALDEEEVFAICPFCERLENNSKCIVQSDDYVDCPMLWSDCCGARAVLDPKEFETLLEKQESGYVPLLLLNERRIVTCST